MFICNRLSMSRNVLKLWYLYDVNGVVCRLTIERICMVRNNNNKKSNQNYKKKI